MALITEQYRTLQSMLHTANEHYGISSRNHVEQIRSICDQLKTRDVLDYGCGKCMLQKGLPFPIQNYDPCIPEWNRAPEPAQIVVCTDVLEHIEPDCLEDVLADLARLTKSLLVVEVACRPASKFLADGRNAHLIQETPTWWLQKLLPHFDLYQYHSSKKAFIAMMLPPTPYDPGEAPNAT